VLVGERVGVVDRSPLREPGGAESAPPSGAQPAGWLEPACRRGERLHELRGPRPQRDVAAAAHISRVYLSELERGIRPRPRRSTLDRLAAALGAPPDELRSPTPPPPRVIDKQPSAGTLAPPGEPQTTRTHGKRSPNGVTGAPAMPPEGPLGEATATGPAAAAGAAAASGRTASAGPTVSADVPTFRVYRSGTRGDPRDPEEAPMPLGYERVPVGKETLIGGRGFSVIVRGEQLHGWRVHDGDHCVVNPEQPARNGSLVAAEVEDEDGEKEMGIFELAEDGSGHLRVRPSHDDPPLDVPLRSYRLLGPVVGIMTWRSPDEGRNNARRTRRVGARALEAHYERGEPILPVVSEGDPPPSSDTP
jgi:transcriptional regulator with XRE-family HTH domain